MALNWQQITEDYAQKYQGTWGWVALTGKERELFQLDHVEYTGSEPYLHLRNRNQGEIILRYDTENEIEFLFPESGVYQLEQFAVIFFKGYVRQFKKGLSNHTASVIIPYTSWVPFTTEIWTEHVLKQLFKPVKPIYYKDAIGQLGDKLSIALSDKFSLGLNITEEKDYLLWYLDIPVGFVSSTGAHLKEPQFQQEWDDYLKRTGPSRYVHNF